MRPERVYSSVQLRSAHHIESRLSKSSCISIPLDSDWLAFVRAPMAYAGRSVAPRCQRWIDCAPQESSLAGLGGAPHPSKHRFAHAPHCAPAPPGSASVSTIVSSVQLPRCRRVHAGHRNFNLLVCYSSCSCYVPWVFRHLRESADLNYGRSLTFQYHAFDTMRAHQGMLTFFCDKFVNSHSMHGCKRSSDIKEASACAWV